MKSAQDILKEYWGYESFRSPQYEVIASVLEGKDTLALLPTGGGKSLCYQIPALMMDGICVVISPLIALMKDQAEGLIRRGIPAIALHSGLAPALLDKELDKCIAGEYKFVFVSPERIRTTLFTERYKQMKVNLLAVDEAHCISQWGYDFRPVYLKIADLRVHHAVTVLALTATATPEVCRDIQEKLEFRKESVLHRISFRRKNLVYSVMDDEDKESRMLELLRSSEGSAIVYARNRKRTRELSDFLTRNGIPSGFYHAGLDFESRTNVQEAWMKGEFRVMVATNAFGMGIDKPDVRLVLHEDLPESPESYFQEAGRAGRDGKRSDAVLIIQENDRNKLLEYIRSSYPDPDTISRIYGAVCNYLRVAFESGEGTRHPFDLGQFCNQFSQEPYVVHASLRLLEREGWLSYAESVYEPARIWIKAGRQEVYDFLIRYPQFEGIISSILRTYPGVLEEYVQVNPAAIARKLSIHESDLLKSVKALEGYEILHFIPASGLPVLTFLRSRPRSGEVKMTEAVYGMLKSQALKRAEAMIRYSKNQETCRSVQLLEYFGERRSEPCGGCDICLSDDRNITAQDMAEFRSYLNRYRTGDEMKAEDLFQHWGKPATKKYLGILREATDLGYISMNKPGYITIK